MVETQEQEATLERDRTRYNSNGEAASKPEEIRRPEGTFVSFPKLSLEFTYLG